MSCVVCRVVGRVCGERFRSGRAATCGTRTSSTRAVMKSGPSPTTSSSSACTMPHRCPPSTPASTRPTVPMSAKKCVSRARTHSHRALTDRRCLASARALWLGAHRVRRLLLRSNPRQRIRVPLRVLAHLPELLVRDYRRVSCACAACGDGDDQVTPLGWWFGPIQQVDRHGVSGARPHGRAVVRGLRGVVVGHPRMEAGRPPESNRMRSRLLLPSSRPGSGTPCVRCEVCAVAYDRNVLGCV
jgi:hypothetical protein